MKAIINETDQLIFPLITVVMFTLMFLGTLLWVYRRGGREVYARRSEMVFEDGTRANGKEATRG